MKEKELTVDGFCKRHKPRGKELGFIGWMEWADKKRKAGDRQRQCKQCKNWLFKEEF